MSTATVGWVSLRTLPVMLTTDIVGLDGHCADHFECHGGRLAGAR